VISAERVALDGTKGSELPGLDLEPLVLGRTYQKLLVRVQLARRTSASRLPRLASGADVYRDFARLSDLDREAFLVLLLDQKNRVTGVHVVSIGSLNASLVHPREVFKAAILGNAAAIIVIHNHPSGDPTPSRGDIEMTQQVKDALDKIGIALHDHVVIGRHGHESFRAKGLL